MRMSPCKDCAKRHPNCHAHCKEYIEFDNENKAERERRAMATMLNHRSPSQQARFKNDTMFKLRRGSK